MTDKIIINSSKDYFNMFVEEYGFTEENLGCEKKLKLNPEYGVGYISRYDYDNGLGISVYDITPIKNIRFNYKMNMAVFETTFVDMGEIIHFEKGLGVTMLKLNQFAVFMKNEAEGWIECGAGQTVKIICASAKRCFLEGFTVSDNNSIAGFKQLNDKAIEHLMEPCVIYPKLKIPFIQIKNCRLKGINKLIFLQGKAMEIISAAIENEIEIEKQNCSENLFKKSEIQKIKLVKNIIIDNLSEPLSIDELSKRVGLNTFKLKTGFKCVYGKTIFQFLKDVRLEKARELLLKNKEINIIDIVNEVGYSNAGHFAKAFREKYGLNPRDFRF